MKILDQDTDQYDDKSIFAKAAKIERLTDELLHVHDLQGIPQERKEYIHLSIQDSKIPGVVSHLNDLRKQHEKLDEEIENLRLQIQGLKPSPSYMRQINNLSTSQKQDEEYISYQFIFLV